MIFTESERNMLTPEHSEASLVLLDNEKLNPDVRVKVVDESQYPQIMILVPPNQDAAIERVAIPDLVARTRHVRQIRLMKHNNVVVFFPVHSAPFNTTEYTCTGSVACTPPSFTLTNCEP